jgi:hypothetical protein
VRLVEIRLLEGPNLYRLEPAVKVEVAVGAEEAWHGERDAAEGVAARLWANVPPSRRPAEVARLAGWCGRLREEAGKGPAAEVHVHRGADSGHWIVSFPGAAPAGPDRQISLAARGRGARGSRGCAYRASTSSPPSGRSEAPPTAAMIPDDTRRIGISISGRTEPRHRMITRLGRRAGSA